MYIEYLAALDYDLHHVAVFTRWHARDGSIKSERQKERKEEIDRSNYLQSMVKLKKHLKMSLSALNGIEQES